MFTNSSHQVDYSLGHFDDLFRMLRTYTTDRRIDPLKYSVKKADLHHLSHMVAGVEIDRRLIDRRHGPVVVPFAWNLWQGVHEEVNMAWGGVVTHAYGACVDAGIRDALYELMKSADAQKSIMLRLKFNVVLNAPSRVNERSTDASRFVADARRLTTMERGF